MNRWVPTLVLVGVAIVNVCVMAWGAGPQPVAAAPPGSPVANANDVDFACVLGVEGATGATAIGEDDMVIWGNAESGEGPCRSRVALVNIDGGRIRWLQVPGIVNVGRGTSSDLDADGQPELLMFGGPRWSLADSRMSSAALAWDLERPWRAPAILGMDINVDLVPPTGGGALGADPYGPIVEFMIEPGPTLIIARVTDVPGTPSGGFVYRCMWRGELDGDDQAEVVLGGYTHVSDGWRALLYICHEDGSVGRHCILPFQCVVQDVGAVGKGLDTALVAAVGYPISHRESLTRGLLKVLRVDKNHAVSIVCDAPPPFNSQLSWASLASLENGEVAVAWVAGKLPSTWPNGGMQEYHYTQLCAYRLGDGGLECTGSRRLEAHCRLLGSLPAPADSADKSGPRLLLWVSWPTVDGGKTPPVYSTSPLPFGPQGVYLLARRGPEAQPLILTLEPQLQGNLR